MNKADVDKYLGLVRPQIAKTQTFIEGFASFDKKISDVEQFDSMTLSHGNNDREAGAQEMPAPLVELLAANTIYDVNGPIVIDNRQAVFDGLTDGINEYKRRNGGDLPPAALVLSAMQAATAFTGTNEAGKSQFDSLSMSHSESISVVPAAVQVVLTFGIANALPLVAMLPNPMGSNEVPIVSGMYTASSNMGAMKTGEAIDGTKAGLPYIDNHHTLVMEDKTAGAFELQVHVSYEPEIRENRTTKFIVDKNSKAAPFIGGRVRVLVKGVEVANDRSLSHATTRGINALQPVGDVEIGAETYSVTSGQASLDNHTINVQFDASKTVPKSDDVEVEISFDYERKDGSDGFILNAPGTDMEFKNHSILAYPTRARSTATIDAITQAANELNINWFGVVLQIFIQKFHFEQTARLLRGAYNQCLASDGEHLISFDADKAGISHTNMSEMFSNVRVTLGKGRSTLSTLTNTPITGYDIYVSDKGAAFFEALNMDVYTPTGESYGDQFTVYRIGTLNNGANVYYVPNSMGVFNEDDTSNVAYALQIARSNDPARAPFVGTVAVPPMALSSNANAFVKDGAMYTRQAAQRNPIPRFSNQFVLIELLNLPAL